MVIATPISLGWSWPLTIATFWESLAIYFHHGVIICNLFKSRNGIYIQKWWTRLQCCKYTANITIAIIAAQPHLTTIFSHLKSFVSAVLKTRQCSPKPRCSIFHEWPLIIHWERIWISHGNGHLLGGLVQNLHQLGWHRKITTCVSLKVHFCLKFEVKGSDSKRTWGKLPTESQSLNVFDPGGKWHLSII